MQEERGDSALFFAPSHFSSFPRVDMLSIKHMLWMFPLLAIFTACNDKEEEKLAQIEAKAERTRTVMANQCSSDADCKITGCRNTMCRAMPEPDYCDHRIVLSMDSPEDTHIVKRIVAEQLTLRESDTIRIGGYSANRWTLSFHATQVQRKRVETTLNSLAQSGLARIHPKAADYTEKAYALLSPNDPDIALRPMKGVGRLIEKKIRSGDVLSKDDIRNSWEQITSIQEVRLGDNDDNERIWSYDVLFGSISQLRLWPIDKRQRLSVRLWKSFNHRIDNGDIIIQGELNENMISTLESWTRSGQILLLTLGNEIIATAIPTVPIINGRFELVIHDGAKNENLTDAVDMLESITQMHGAVYIDDDATKSVERDITCQERYPRECACLEGYCGWRPNSQYNACLYE